MTGHGAKFARKKEAAIMALLTQRNVEEAARAVDIGTQTLYRWMKDPEFDAAYRGARRAALGQSIARLQQGSGAAVSTMLKIMVDSGTPASTRLRAADCVFGHAKQGIEMEDIDARLAALENARAVKPARGARKVPRGPGCRIR
jgi:transposase-like protein